MSFTYMVDFLRRNQPAKRKARPDIVHSTQPNPNTSFAANGGFENKGVDTVKDNHDDSDPMIKNNIYSVQNGYQYNGAHTYPEQVCRPLVYRVVFWQRLPELIFLIIRRTYGHKKYPLTYV